MLIASHSIYGSSIVSTDGPVGSVRDLLFDDRSWQVCHLVVHAGNWLTGKCELLSPDVVTGKEWMAHRLLVRLRSQEVKDSPSIETHLPLAIQKEREQRKLIAWDAYWTGILSESPDEEADPHLDSAKEVTGYHVQAIDGEIGHVQDFIVDDETWLIHYLVINTRNWVPGKHAIVLPATVESIDWNLRKIQVNLRRATIKDSPNYDHTVPVDRRYEEILYRHYGKPGYWVAEGPKYSAEHQNL